MNKFLKKIRLMRFGVYFERSFNIKWLVSCINNYINYSGTRYTIGFRGIAPQRKF